MSALSRPAHLLFFCKTFTDDLIGDSSNLATNYLFAGQQYDNSTELYSMRARYYDAGIGRFTARDTYSYNFRNPIELNRYVYTANNPVNDAVGEPKQPVSQVEFCAFASEAYCFASSRHVKDSLPLQ